MTENEISYIIRGAIFKVHHNFGSGLLESVYCCALAHEIQKCGLKVRLEVGVPVIYENEKLGLGFRVDILVEEKVVVEVKSIEDIADIHHKQVLTYLRLANLKLGILVNFNVVDIKKGIFRKINGYL